MLLAILSAPAAAMANSTYEGTVTKHEGGAPIAFVGVRVEGISGGTVKVLAETQTESNGSWQVVVGGASEVVKTYVEFHYPQYQTEWYGGSFSFGMATLIPWEEFKTHAGLNAAMYPAAKIEGTVTDAKTGEPVSGSKIVALTPDGSTQAGNPALSNSKGEYTITMEDLPPGGNVKVQFLTEGVYYLRQYYGGQFSLPEASILGVAPTVTISNANVALVHAGKITGRITDAVTGVGLEKIYVRAYDAAGQRVAFVTNGLTGGNYTASVPGGGSYTVDFVDSSEHPTYATQYYNAKAGPTCATPVAVAADQTVANINAAMTTSAAALGVCAPGGEGGKLPPTVSQIVVALRAAISPGGKPSHITKILKAGGYTYAFRALEAGAAEIDWFEVPPGAHVARRTPKPVLVARGRLSFSKAGTGKLKVKLTRAGRSLLKRAKHIRLTAKGSFTPTGARAASTIKAFSLRR